MNWQKNFKGKVGFGQELKKYTTFKIGGPADILAKPNDIADLRQLVKSARKEKIPLFILGKGSNILVNDKGLRGMVISLSSPHFKKFSWRGNYLEAGSGVSLPQLIEAAGKKGLSGLEFLAGIPGSLGGALVMNAGAFGKSIADLVEKVRIMDYNGKVKELRKSQIKFAYRSAHLEKYIILGAHLKLNRLNPEEIKKRIKRYLIYRQRSQDYGYPSAGCVFKNPAVDSAARLMDLSGLKGKRIGNAAISKIHANFILNLGQASFAEVLKLMRLAKQKVKEKFKVTLRPEIKIWN